MFWLAPVVVAAVQIVISFQLLLCISVSLYEGDTRNRNKKPDNVQNFSKIQKLGIWLLLFYLQLQFIICIAPIAVMRRC
jgi:hypothetical protein